MFVIAVPLTRAVCLAGCWVHLGLNEEQRKMRCTGLPTMSPQHTSPALGLSSPSVQWARASGLTEIGCWDGWPPGRARKWPPGRFTSAHMVQLWQSVWNWRGLAGLGGQACCSPSAPLQGSTIKGCRGSISVMKKSLTRGWGGEVGRTLEGGPLWGARVTAGRAPATAGQVLQGPECEMSWGGARLGWRRKGCHPRPPGRRRSGQNLAS